MNRSGTSKTLFALVLGFFLAANVGGFFAAEVMMSDEGMEHHCPFMGIPALCTMNPAAHIAEWQQMFAATAPHLVSTIVLILFLVFAVAWCFVEVHTHDIRTRERIPRYKDIPRPGVDSLRFALSRGILHSKAF